MAENGGTGPRGPRCIALVGPFQSGKTTLLEGNSGAHRRDRAPGHRRGRLDRRRRLQGSAPSPDERRAFGRDHDFPRRQLHLHRLPRLGRIHPRHARGAAAVDAAVVVCEADEKKVPQLQLILRELEDLKIPRFLFLNKIDKADKRVRETLQAAAAGLARAAGAAPDPDLDERHRHRLRRPRARARAYLQGACAVRGRAARRRERRPREGSALHHAGDARRPRRRADGAVARGHPAAARQGVRRPRQGIARRPDLPGADRLGDAHQRRAAADEGAAPRGAGRRRHRQAPRRQADRRCGRLRAQDAAHRAWRQDVGRARARGQVGDGTTFITPETEPAACPACSSCSATAARSAAPRRPARRSRSASSITPRPATR